MSRTYRKSLYRQALKNGYFKEEFIGKGLNIRCVPCTPEREKALCKIHSSKYQTGARSAPSKWVRELFTVPFRRKDKTILYKILAGYIDSEEAIFSKYCKGAWWLWY